MSNKLRSASNGGGHAETKTEKEIELIMQLKRARSLATREHAWGQVRMADDALEEQIKKLQRTSGQDLSYLLPSDKSRRKQMVEAHI